MRSIEQIMTDVCAALDSRKNEILKLGDYFWHNPESGYKEFKTSKYAAEQLRSLGLTVSANKAITGFRADIDTGKPGPVIAVLGEMDSLIIPNHPECDKQTGCVHSCGHHAQITALIATAMGLLDAHVKDELCGKIALIACPAEEGIEMDYRKSLIKQGKIKSIAGKSQLIREGVFDDVDAALMNHLSWFYGYEDHNGCVNKRIIIHGKSCHAASPERGCNALNGSGLIQNAVGLMRESLSRYAWVRIHGIITNGGTAVNIIPDTVTMEYMVRAPKLEQVLELSKRFDSVVLHAAAAAECTAEVETVNGYMPLIDNVDMGKVMAESLHFVYPDKVFATTDFSAGCTDMGDVGTVMPVVHGYVPGKEGTSHGIDYHVSDPYNAYVVNAKIQALSVVKLLYGDAACGKKIAAQRDGLISIPEYIRIIDSLNQTVRL